MGLVEEAIALKRRFGGESPPADDHLTHEADPLDEHHPDEDILLEDG